MTPPVGGLPLGCAPGSKAGATTPVLDAASNGRFQIAPGDKLVLELYWLARRLREAQERALHPDWTDDEVVAYVRKIFLRART